MSILRPKFVKFSVFVLLVFGVGYIVGNIVDTYVKAEKTPFRSLENFAKVLEFVEVNYVDEVSASDLVEKAIEGMVQSLDPHSSYLSPDVFREVKEETSGRFGGVGIEVSVQDNQIVVVSPIEDSPAYRAGILAGDVIVEVDSANTKDISLAEAINKMRGDLGTKVKLGVLRKGEKKVLDFTLVRENIRMKSVKHALLNPKAGYLRISSFQERTSADLREAIIKLKQSSLELKGVVLDLRGNPGGLLDEAIKVVNLFIDEGAVVHTIGRDRQQKTTENVKKGQKIFDGPLVVLIDGGSASASEIVAGALQDHGRAIIAGTKSFGKGSVQSVVSMNDGAGLKLTIARYYTPNMRSIQALGIEPDVELLPIDQKILEEARNKAVRLSEADLSGHIRNDDEVKSETSSPNMSEAEKKTAFHERLKSDYVVTQAVGLLNTIAIIKK